MLSLSQIREHSRQAALHAARDRKEPFIVESEDIADWTSGRQPLVFPFPFTGEYLPPGWEQVNTYFVDASGFGSPDEMALTAGQFLARLIPGHGYAITEAGEFQVIVGEFERRRVC